MYLKSLVVAGIAALCFSSFTVKSQDLLHMMDSAQNTPATAKPELPPTWKDTRLIDAQTTKIPAPGIMEFRIMHRFGNVGGNGSGGFHTLYGFDIASDILFSFEFGIIKNLMIGVSRSKQQELLDLTAKYKFLTQKTDGMPVSAAIYEDVGITPETGSVFYSGSAPGTPNNFFDRISYFSELIVDRRFNDHISVELLGGLSHRNYVLANVNTDNGSTDENNIPFAGIGGRVMFNKHSGIVFDYYYLFSQFRTNNSTTPFFTPLSIGYEVETGGHVFEINFTNASFLDENNLIPYTQSSWLKNGGFKLGFSISRVFNL